MPRNMPSSRIVRETRSTVFQSGKVYTMMLEWHNGIVCVWPKGTRQKQYVDIGGCWQRAVKAEVEAKKAARRKQLGVRRRPRRRNTRPRK